MARHITNDYNEAGNGFTVQAMLPKQINRYTTVASVFENALVEEIAKLL